jgi:hypothetical protein
MTDTRSLRDDLRERMNAPGPTVTITKAQLAYLLGQSAPGLDVERLARALEAFYIAHGFGPHAGDAERFAAAYTILVG